MPSEPLRPRVARSRAAARILAALALGFGGASFGPTADSSQLYFRCVYAKVNG